MYLLVNNNKPLCIVVRWLNFSPEWRDSRRRRSFSSPLPKSSERPSRACSPHLYVPATARWKQSSKAQPDDTVCVCVLNRDLRSVIKGYYRVIRIRWRVWRRRRSRMKFPWWWISSSRCWMASSELKWNEWILRPSWSRSRYQHHLFQEENPVMNKLIPNTQARIVYSSICSTEQQEFKEEAWER